MPGASCQRPPHPHPFLGLAVYYRLCRHHPSLRLHPGQGIRRTHLAHQSNGRGHLARLRRKFFLDPREAQRAQHLRRDLVLHRHHRHGYHALRGQPPLAPDELYPQLFPLRRGAGRPRSMVVWSQRRGVLPHHPDPRDHVLFRAKGRQSSGLFLPALGCPLLVAGLYLHLGRSAPPAQHRPPQLAAVPWDALLSHALGALLGRYAERSPHPPWRMG